MNGYVLPTVFFCFAVAAHGEINGLGGAGVPNVNDLPIAEGENMLKEKCAKNSASNNSYDVISEAKNNLEACVTSLINVDELNREIEVAKPTGDIDVVFNKYCRKVPDFKNCVYNYTNALDACLDDTEKVTKKIITNVTESLITFMCYDEGDRLALFYAEGGKDCLMGKKEGIQQCFNSTMRKYGQMEYKFEETQCKSMNHLKQCIVTELEKCNQPTPANMMDALFELIRRKTPCSRFGNGRT